MVFAEYGIEMARYGILYFLQCIIYFMIFNFSAQIDTLLLIQ